MTVKARAVEPDSLVGFFHSHTLLAVGILVALGVFAYLKPKAMFKLMAVVLVIGAIGYVTSFLLDLTSTGVKDKDKLMGNSTINSTR